MKRNTIVVLFILFVVIVLLFMSCGNDASAAGSKEAHWGMNERRGHILHDSAGSPQDGHIGKHVKTTGSYHHFPFVNQLKKIPGHIDVVPDSPVLDPGSKNFSVAARVRFNTMADRNIIQKGQGTPAGGIFKMKVKGVVKAGWVECIYKGSKGNSYVDSNRDLGNNKWHTIRCVRTHHGTTMFVDGKKIEHNPKNPGIISNTWPVAIGGNTYCWEDAARRCNYWHGDIGNLIWHVNS